MKHKKILIQPVIRIKNSKVNCIICENDNTGLYGVVGRYTVVKCLNDNLIYINPQPSVDEYKNFYGTNYFRQGEEVSIGQGYSNYLSERNIYQKNFLRILHKIEKLKPLKGRILDIGCAFGFFVELAQAKRWEAYGVELNKEVAQWARDSLKVNIFAGTTSSCNFPDAYFDAVCLTAVIEHLLNPFEELKEIFRILKKDGLLCIITPDIDIIKGKMFLKPPEHLYYFSKHTLRRLLAKAGFSVCTLEHYFKFFSIQGLINIFFRYIYGARGRKSLRRVSKYINSIVNLLMMNKFTIIFPAGQMLVIAKKND